MMTGIRAPVNTKLKCIKLLEVQWHFTCIVSNRKAEAKLQFAKKYQISSKQSERSPLRISIAQTSNRTTTAARPLQLRWPKKAANGTSVEYSIARSFVYVSHGIHLNHLLSWNRHMHCITRGWRAVCTRAWLLESCRDPKWRTGTADKLITTMSNSVRRVLQR